jgi:beta-mannosidase
MKRIILIIFVFIVFVAQAQQSISLDKGWEFRKVGSDKWYKAEVPGTIHTDLLANKLIPDPFYRDNESKVQWVENETWEYRTTFDIPHELFDQEHIEIQFDGLDTYADIYLNGTKIIRADNMFRQWTADIKLIARRAANKLLIVFSPAAILAKKTREADSIRRPDNERVYVRKAQYQFGWDWGPRLVTCGIWKEVRLITTPPIEKPSAINDIKLITGKDSIGESFYFSVNGKPTFIKGANWIPLDNFLPRAKKSKRYEQLIKAAKEANINMLRVWGGGVYEDDVFYDLCDKYGIMVWQDFMFAGALYPADSSALRNIEAEIRYQVKRLRNHPCIALWCGNNEIEEAWFNWGWQKQFNYSAGDSLTLWNDYKKIFHELIPGILKELDPQRPYWPSSPSLGWGRDSAYKKGDVHYWGVWWGKEPVEKYNEKVGRFVSEYGMQGMPGMKTIEQFSLPPDRDTSSAVMRTHQKHPFGWENIKYYIEQKFRAPKSFKDLVYVSQLMQADAIKTAIEAHRRNKPTTMGTMFWQWNDCWPVTSWSAVDYYGRKKALYYEVKRSYNDLVILPIDYKGRYWFKVINESKAISSVQIVVDYIDFNKGVIWFESPVNRYDIKEDTTCWISMTPNLYNEKRETGCVRVRLQKDETTIASNFLFFNTPKALDLPKAKININITASTITLTSDKFAYGVYIDVPDGVELEDNFFHLVPGEKKIVNFTSSIPLDQLRRNIKTKSLADTY